MKRYYTGIGSRKIPPEIRDKFILIGRFLATKSLTLRSGAAQGADASFEIGCDKEGGDKEIYLPWRGFNDHPSNLFIFRRKRKIWRNIIMVPIGSLYRNIRKSL